MAIRVHSSLALAALGVGVAFMACGPSAESNPSPPGPSTTGPITTVPTNGPDPNIPPTDVAPTGSAPVGVGPTDVTPTPIEPNECDGPGTSYVPTMLNDGVCETT